MTIIIIILVRTTLHLQNSIMENKTKLLKMKQGNPYADYAFKYYVYCT